MDARWKTHITSPVINYWGKKKEKRTFSTPPILIGGCGRSGTTLLLAILSAHPHIYAFPHEVDAFTAWKRWRGKLIPKRADRLYRYLLTHSIPTGVHRWCEKRPANVHFIPEILEYFGGGMRFIHIIRDPRAVCTSRHPKKPNAYWISPERWVADVSAGFLYTDHPQVFTLKYEDLVLDAKNQIMAMCDFLGEPVIDPILNWYDHATVRQNTSWFDGLKGLDPGSLGKWKEPENKGRVEAIMQDKKVQEMMMKLGYGKT